MSQPDLCNNALWRVGNLSLRLIAALGILLFFPLYQIQATVLADTKTNRRAAAERLIEFESANKEANLEFVLNTLVENKSITADLRTRILSLYRGLDHQKINATAAVAMSEVLSLNEIDGVARFYDSDLGRSIVRKLPLYLMRDNRALKSSPILTLMPEGMREELMAMKDEGNPDYRKVLDMFTSEEIDALVEFYTSDVGQELARKSHQMASEMVRLSDGELDSYFRRLGQLIEAHDTMIRGAQFYRKGDYSNAKLLFELAAKQGDAVAAHALGNMYSHGRGVARNYEKAKQYYGLGAESGHVSSIMNLAWLLATCPDDAIRDGNTAVALAEKGAKQDPRAAFLDTLASAYAEAERFTEAIKTQEKAISRLQQESSSSSSSGYAARLERYQRRLATYRSGKPWREKG